VSDEKKRRLARLALVADHEVDRYVSRVNARKLTMIESLSRRTK
jgi:hypothetical protein